MQMTTLKKTNNVVRALLAIGCCFMLLRCSDAAVKASTLRLESNPRITTTVKNRPLAEALESLFTGTGMHIKIDSKVPLKTVTFEFSDIPLSDAVSALEQKQGLAFKNVSPTLLFVTWHAAESSNAAGVQEHTAVLEEPTSGAANSMKKPMTLDEALNASSTPPPVESIQKTNEADVASAKTPLKLEAGIEHNVRLSPVSSEFRVGTRVDVAKLKAMTPGNQWARLPAWCAGSWKSTHATAYYFYHYQQGSKDFDTTTFTQRAAETFCWQRDRKGDYWHFIGNNYHKVVEGDGYWAVQFVKAHEILQSNAKQFTAHFIAVVARVDKASLRVRDVHQTESIQTYTLADGGNIRVKASMKRFDADGMPITLQKAICYEYKIKEFSPWNTDEGHDMRALFAEYLANHGLADLIPG